MTIECPNCAASQTVPNKTTAAAPRLPFPQQRIVSETQALPVNDTKKCPFCAETIKAVAKVCRFCGRELVLSQFTFKPKESSPLPKILVGLVVLVVMIGGLVGFFTYSSWKRFQLVPLAAAQEAMDGAHSIQASLDMGMTYQNYDNKVDAFATKRSKLEQAILDAGREADASYALRMWGAARCLQLYVKLLKSLTQVQVSHIGAEGYWKSKIKLSSTFTTFDPKEHETEMQEKWQEASMSLNEAEAR